MSRPITNIAGLRFGKLVVIEYFKDSKWKCECDCGSFCIVQTGHLNSGSTQSCGCERGNHTKYHENLVGKVFGRWLVLEEIGYYKNTSIILWKCKCECGMERNVLGNTLRSGKSLSCGCYMREQSRKINFIDLSGKSFGDLTVIEESNERGGKGEIRWLCECVCGKKVTRSTNVLKTSKLNNCGCYRKINAKPRKDLTGESFGYLFVTGVFKKIESGKIVWECECKCGNVIFVPSSNLGNGHSTSCGCLSESFIATEMKNYFRENYNSISEYKILKNKNTGKWLPYDIYIPRGENIVINGIYIEIQGSQHYIYGEDRKFTKTLADFINRRKLDKLKKQFGKKNGIFIEIDLRKIKTLEQAIEKIEKIISKVQ